MTTPVPQPFSDACERNQGPILEVLQRHFGDRRRVLEIGSGSGQHAVHFAAALPWLRWQASDRADNLPAIRSRLLAAGLANAPAPIRFDVAQADWPRGPYDAVFTANTLHIMRWQEVETLFARLPALLTADALLVIYGPFNYGGRYTSESNALFDAALRGRALHMKLRDFEAVDALASGQGFALVEDCAMPANNRCLVWRRTLTTET